MIRNNEHTPETYFCIAIAEVLYYSTLLEVANSQDLKCYVWKATYHSGGFYKFQNLHMKTHVSQQEL